MRFFIILFLSISMYTFAQGTYNIKFTEFNTWDFKENALGQDPEMASALMEALNESRNYEFILYNKEALYQFIEKDKTVNQGNEVPKTLVSVGNKNEKIFTNYITEKQLQRFTSGGDSIIISKDLKPYKWIIMEDTKEILGYQVQKAICNEGKFDENDPFIITAWFAPKIPFKAGPGEMWGLPGVILEYRSMRQTNYGNKTIHVIAQEINHDKKEGVLFHKPDESNAISEKEYFNKYMQPSLN